MVARVLYTTLGTPTHPTAQRTRHDVQHRRDGCTALGRRVTERTVSDDAVTVIGARRYCPSSVRDVTVRHRCGTESLSSVRNRESLIGAGLINTHRCGTDQHSSVRDRCLSSVRDRCLSSVRREAHCA